MFIGLVLVASYILVTKVAVGAVGAVFVNVVIAAKLTAYMVLVVGVMTAKVTTATVMTLWWL